VKNCALQDDILPWKLVVAKQAIPNNQSEMKMDMNQSSARLVVAKKAQYRGMIAICGRWKQLEALSKQDHFHAVLILSSD